MDICDLLFSGGTGSGKRQRQILGDSYGSGQLLGIPTVSEDTAVHTLAVPGNLCGELGVGRLVENGTCF